MFHSSACFNTLESSPPYGSSAQEQMRTKPFLLFLFLFLFLCDSDQAVLIAGIKIINWHAMKVKMAEYEEEERGKVLALY